MKRPSMKIGRKAVGAAEVNAAVSTASLDWLRGQRAEKSTVKKRKHRALTSGEREAKAQATAQAKKERKEQREARELERLLARVGYLSRRSAREAEAMLRVHVSWRPSSWPKIATICPRSLYSRMRPEISNRTAKSLTRSRTAADGFKNIVLRKIPRGYGRKAANTREYRPGEAADLARYMLREEALEPGTPAVFTNIIACKGDNALFESDAVFVEHRRCAQIVGFWNALEAFEAEADADGNVFSHLILAMPHELSSNGRARALDDFCARLDELHLPFLATLHQPDPDGDIRNFHAHIMMAPRPFAIEGPFEWSLEASKATEFNLAPGIRWLRERAAEAFNRILEEENISLRYSGMSQAKRGVPATHEKHHGPGLTARNRKAEQDRDEVANLIRGLAAHVVQADRRQRELAAEITHAASQNRVETARKDLQQEPRLPPALAALRKRFPDPLRLKGLSILDLMDFTPADEAADRWFSPAINLAFEIERNAEGCVRDRNGKPELAVEKVKPEYRALAAAPALPDIVLEALLQTHRRLMAERASKKRYEREKEEIRRRRIAWLQKKGTVLLFDKEYNVLPEYRDLFPPSVMALDGVRKAMIRAHYPAQMEETRRTIEEHEQEVGSDHFEGEPRPPGFFVQEPASKMPAPAPSRPDEDEDIDYAVRATWAAKGGKQRG